MLQRNLPEEVKARRKYEYKEWKRKVRELIEESKRRMDEEFGRKLSQNFCENKKLFWKEVKKVRGGERSGAVRIRGVDGEPVEGESELKGLWKGYFEQQAYLSVHAWLWRRAGCGAVVPLIPLQRCVYMAMREVGRKTGCVRVEGEGL